MMGGFIGPTRYGKSSEGAAMLADSKIYGFILLSNDSRRQSFELIVQCLEFKT